MLNSPNQNDFYFVICLYLLVVDQAIKYKFLINFHINLTILGTTQTSRKRFLSLFEIFLTVIFFFFVSRSSDLILKILSKLSSLSSELLWSPVLDFLLINPRHFGVLQ